VTVGEASRRAVRERLLRTTSTWYIESSALLAAQLEEDDAANDALRAAEQRVTSALTVAETNRGVVRARMAGRLTAAKERAVIYSLERFFDECFVVPLSDAVLARAGRPFPVEPIRTLDAIHLATAELLGEPPQLVTILTRDSRVRENARALGYAVA